MKCEKCNVEIPYRCRKGRPRKRNLCQDCIYEELLNKPKIKKIREQDPEEFERFQKFCESVAKKLNNETSHIPKIKFQGDSNATD